MAAPLLIVLSAVCPPTSKTPNQAFEPQKHKDKHMPGGEAAEEYHSKDFEWDQLRQEIEADPSLRYHLLPLHVNADDDDANSIRPSSSSQSLSGSSSSPSHDSEAWNNFHARHSSGKFFKVLPHFFHTHSFVLACCDFPFSKLYVTLALIIRVQSLPHILYSMVLYFHFAI